MQLLSARRIIGLTCCLMVVMLMVFHYDAGTDSLYKASLQVQSVLVEKTVNADMRSRETFLTARDGNSVNAPLGYDPDKAIISAALLEEFLQSVRTGNDGELVLDHLMLQALETFFFYQDLALDEQQLLILEDLIIQALPERAGQQMAEIASNYFRFLLAEKELNQRYQLLQEVDMELFKLPGHFEAQHEELSALRALHLGGDVAAKLYAVSDANARYMFASNRYEAEPSLTPEIKAARQAEIIYRHTLETIEVDNWHDRYHAFLEDKRQLADAALSTQDKRQALNLLLTSHFDAAELKKMSRLDLSGL